jgi:hypothetical protein
MKCNGVVLKDSQSSILNELTSSSRKNSLHIFTVDKGLDLLEGYIEEMKNNY